MLNGISGSVVALHKDWITQNLKCEPGDLFYMQAADSDMEPLIRVGEIMIINRTDPLLGDGIYVLRMAEQVTVKRLQFVGANAHVRAEAEGYRSWAITNPRMNSEASIIGRVVWWSRRM